MYELFLKRNSVHRIVFSKFYLHGIIILMIVIVFNAAQHVTSILILLSTKENVSFSNAILHSLFVFVDLPASRNSAGTPLGY